MAKLYFVNGRIFYDDSDRLSFVNGRIIEGQGAASGFDTNVTATSDSLTLAPVAQSVQVGHPSVPWMSFF